MPGAVNCGGSAPLVGRDAEIRQLGEALERSVAGHGGVVLLAGEPGIGKSRLSDEIASRARGLGAQVLASRCYEWGGAPAYWPWKQAISTYFDAHGVAGAAARLGRTLAPMASIIPIIEEIMPVAQTTPGTNPDYERFQIFEACGELLRYIADQEPVIFVLDDLHWADAASLLLLEYLTPTIREARVLIVGTFRDTEVARGTQLSRTLGKLTREPNVERIALHRLSRAEVVDFVTNSTGQAATATVTGKVYETSDGNPLFVTEIVRMLAGDFGVGWTTSAKALEVRLPDSIRDTVLQRLDRLPEECVEALSVASVIGRDFNLSLLSEAMNRDVDTILAVLEPALRGRIIEPSSEPGRYRFSHVLVQEAVYEESSAAERAQLHLRIAEALERTDAGPSVNVAEIAHHYYRALPVSDAERAIRYAIEAGDQAVQQVAWESAIELYERALTLLDSGQASDGATRCDVLLSLGSAQWLSGETDAARSSFQAALEAARRLGSTNRQAQAVLGIAGSDVIGLALRDPLLITLVEDALAALGPEDSPLRVRLLCQLVYLNVEGADHVRQRYDYGEEAVAMARRLGDVPALLQALDAAWYALQGPDMLRQRMAIADEQLRVAEQAGDRYAAMLAHSGKANDALSIGDIPAYSRQVAIYGRLANELRLPVHLLGSKFLHAILAVIEGRVEDGRRVIEQIPPDHVAALPSGAGRRLLDLLLVTICHEQERLAEIVDQAEALPIGVNLGGELQCQMERALVHLELGNHEPARQLIERLDHNSLRALPRDEYWISTLVRAAEFAITFDDLERAAVLYDLLRDYPDENAMAGLQWVCYGSVSHWLGLLATALERFDVAQQHFEHALTMHERMGAHLFSSQTRVAYAQMLADRNRPGDREQALDLVNLALAASEEFGLIRLAKLARSTFEPVTASPASSEHGLSTREMEVLRLVVEGLSDREIGEALSISHRTVMRHVTHILNKLAVNSRTAAAAAAIRRGIA